jgi:hypothetical protein
MKYDRAARGAKGKQGEKNETSSVAIRSTPPSPDAMDAEAAVEFDVFIRRSGGSHMPTAILVQQ